MRVRTPIIALLGVIAFAGCVVETTPTGRPNPNTGAGGSGVPGAGGTGVPGAGGTGVPGAGGTGVPGAGGTGVPGAGGTGVPGAGGTVPGAGGTDPGAGGASGTGTGGSGGVQCGVPSTDPNCTSSLAKTDATCTVDCCIACGYNGLGTKTCSCNGTVYTACPCAKPAVWNVPAEVSATCATLIGNDGLVETNDETPCTTEWDACIAADDLVAAGTTTSRGCVCLPDNEAGGALMWSCGSTNKWFTCPVGMSYAGCPPPA